jgi:hypothetical protein
VGGDYCSHCPSGASRKSRRSGLKNGFEEKWTRVLLPFGHKEEKYQEQKKSRTKKIKKKSPKFRFSKI